MIARGNPGLWTKLRTRFARAGCNLRLWRGQAEGDDLAHAALKQNRHCEEP
jgi:hypothetical protein